MSVTIAIALAGIQDQLDGALRDSLATLRHDPEIIVVIEVSDVIDDVLTLREEHDFDALVMLMRNSMELPRAADQLLGEYPELTIVTVASSGTKAFVYELRPQLTLLEVPDGSLASAIKRAVGRHRR